MNKSLAPISTARRNALSNLEYLKGEKIEYIETETEKINNQKILIMFNNVHKWKIWVFCKGDNFLNVPEEMVEKSASQSADGISKVKDDNFWQWVLRSIECSQCGLQLAYHNEEKNSVQANIYTMKKIKERTFYKIYRESHCFMIVENTCTNIVESIKTLS